MRDIPADYIVEGTRKSNLRQIIQRRMADEDRSCRCIRCREIRGRDVLDITDVALDDVVYGTRSTDEHFLQYLTPTGRLAGFLRLSLPRGPRVHVPIPEIRSAAMVRELHVYGPAQGLGDRGTGAQHRGLGTRLLEDAAKVATAAGYSRACGDCCGRHQPVLSRARLHLRRSLSHSPIGAGTRGWGGRSGESEPPGA